MSRRTAIVLIVAALALLVVGLATSITALALIGLFGAVVVAAVWALAAGGDFIRDASARRFTRNGGS